MSLNLEIKWEEEDLLIFKCKKCNALTRNNMEMGKAALKVQSTCPICHKTQEWNLDLNNWSLPGSPG
ncbi:MAG: hypothetical protein GWM98_04990 [Nitrospinaceae bacterium]|nr:hypothetical protein [Nitrospinaceae bacterium]NIR53926.1 hypothetical protein [Nitrospinaceae bacterium]NIS84344.1 hypothetical protein [Nitrospinaceae bacterium]NIT81147.1 hypothetical protein [Nitrospinaceae bacterium]NIU43429.1 hypothetical protein [Nitrospinaceae bacterium]